MNFDEWFLSNGIPLDTDFNVAKRAFEAGAQSQQAKIDEFNEKHSEEKRILHNVIEMNQSKIDELQARVDVYDEHVKALKNIHENDFNEESKSSYILGNLDGFFECIESDLKVVRDD